MFKYGDFTQVRDGQFRTAMYIENVRVSVLAIVKEYELGVAWVGDGDNRLMVMTEKNIRVPNLAMYYKFTIKSLNNPVLKTIITKLLWFNRGAKDNTRKMLATHVIQNYCTNHEVMTYEAVRPIVDKVATGLETNRFASELTDKNIPVLYSYNNNYTSDEKTSITLRAYRGLINYNLGEAFDVAVDAFAIANKRLKVTDVRVLREMNDSREGNDVNPRVIKKAILPKTKTKITVLNSETPRLIGTSASEVKYLEAKDLFSAGASNGKASRDLGISKSTVITYREVFINESKE